MISRPFVGALALALAACAHAGPVPPPAAQVPPVQAAAPVTVDAPTPAALAEPLPVDTAVRIDTLPNGLRYYIRKNAEPRNRAELRLVVDAGSILEDDDQLGLAHFLEHTAFNGTTNFEKNELVHYLQSIGVRFGADLNAQTGFDETIYMLSIPTDTARIVETAFQILEDWAHGQLLDSAEVANERGIVVEEWRGRKGAEDRMLQQWLPVALAGSRYATRLPIGTEQSILAATPAKLRRFYADWYRPEAMAVVAVGDFDPARIEALIEKHFGSIAPSAHPRPRPEFDVPGNAEPLIAIATDPEATGSGVSVIYKRPSVTTRTVGDYRDDLIERLYLGMLNVRLAEIAERPDAPFLGASASTGGFFARDAAAFVLSAGVKDGGIAEGLEAVLVEARRADEFGFLESELEREERDLLRGYERAFAEREKLPHHAFVGEYVQHFLTGEATSGIAYEYPLVQRLLPTITLDDVNRLARAWITDSNRVVVAQAPRKEGVQVPTRAELLAAFERAEREPLTAYAEQVSDEPLLDPLPVPGRIVGARSMPEVGVTEWTLSNGARVLVKPTDFKADEVLLSAYSSGGTSLAPDSIHMSAEYASEVVALGGLGEFNRIDLGKKLSGKAATVSAGIGETTEWLSGRASPSDLETLFQLAYLKFTAPRLDTSAFRTYQGQAAQFIANRGASPEQVFADTIQVTMSQGDFRSRPLTAATFAEVDLEEAFGFYEDRFADAGDFTFVVVGNVDTTTLRPLVERYLASLPSAGRTERWKDVGGAPPGGVVEKVVRRGTEAKANTLMLFTGPAEYTPENRFAVSALTNVVQIMLTEKLREELGGAYSPSVSGGLSRTPREEYAIQVGFGSSPENTDVLARSVFAVIDSLQRSGPTAADVEKVREQMSRGREVQLRQNAYWLANIAARDQAGEDLAGLLGPYDAMVRGLTPGQVQQAARRFLDPKRYARFVLLPERVSGESAPTP